MNVSAQPKVNRDFPVLEKYSFSNHFSFLGIEWERKRGERNRADIPFHIYEATISQIKLYWQDISLCYYRVSV